MVPLIMGFVNSTEGDDELKESCLQTFEALVVRCFREVTAFIPEVQCTVCISSLLVTSSDLTVCISSLLVTSSDLTVCISSLLVTSSDLTLPAELPW